MLPAGRVLQSGAHSETTLLFVHADGPVLGLLKKKRICVSPDKKRVSRAIEVCRNTVFEVCRNLGDKSEDRTDGTQFLTNLKN
jgi:hypothetical protein